MSTIDEEVLRKSCPLSRRLLSTFKISDEMVSKLSSKGFRLKSEIESLSDSSLQSICNLSGEQIEEINRQINNSHKRPLILTNLEEMADNYQFIRTGSYTLDRTLNGGLEVSRITQMSAEGGSGKTQLCMQCCVNVQLPPQCGGLSARALYIDTENNLRPERLEAMAKHQLSTHPDLLSDLSVEKIKSQIFIIECTTNSDDFVDLVLNRVEPFIDSNPEIKLIVIDSIARLFRYDYKGSDKQRDYELSQIAYKLRTIALSKKLAILIANQVSFDKVEGKSKPALGKQWNNYCNTSLYFERHEDGIASYRKGFLLKSNQTELNREFFFEITENGIRDPMSKIQTPFL